MIYPISSMLLLVRGRKSEQVLYHNNAQYSGASARGTTHGHKCDSGAEEKFPLILAAMGGNVKILKPSSLPSSCLLTDRWRTRSLKGGQDNRGKQSKRTRSYQL